MNCVFIDKRFLLGIILALTLVVLPPVLNNGDVALAQDIADTPTGEPTSPPSTDTPIPTATFTPTQGGPTPSAPTQIPEPVTVILFGSGLAALSASVARKRRQK